MNMHGITHKQAQRYLRGNLDGLLTEAQRLDLETHLDSCASCRADSEAFAALTSRLQTQFHSRWDTQDGPSQQVMANIRSQSRRIHMQKQIDFAFNILGGIVTLLVLFFLVTSVISQFQKKTTIVTETQTSIPASAPKEESLLAFTSRQNGNYEIYTVRSDGNDVRNITNHSASDVNPAWSPDGKRIAFQSDRNSEYYSQIFLMEADGSNVVLLTTDKGNHQLPLNFYGSNTNPWSPDGSKLLFLRQGMSEGEWILQSINIENGDITSLVTGRVSLSDVSWSPDGKYIWFILNDPQNTDLGKFVSQIHMVSADGTHLINISSLLPSNETLILPYNYYWSSDGESVSFTSWMTPENATSENHTSKLYKVGIDGSLTLQAAARSPIGGAWNGIYFTISPAPGNWTWVYPDGSFKAINPTKECEQERLYDSSTNSYTSAVANFSQSPNGNGVIIASCPDGNVHLSWVNSAGTEITPIAKVSTAPAIGHLDWMQWSQDDEFVAFHLAASAPSDIYIVNITESLKDPSILPVKISLGRSEFPYLLPAWQPQH
jgi:dipeptidyl aminopeptidase/acylaminoacyl peptidase